GAGWLPSLQSTWADAETGTVAGSGSSPSEMVVSHALPARRPTAARGTTSTDPSEGGSKVKLPKATGPEPGTPTSSAMLALSKSSRSHFSAAVNLSSPAGSVTFAASPHPASPSPRRIQASAAGCGRRPSRSPGSATGTVRTVSLSGIRWPAPSCCDPTAVNFTCGPGSASPVARPCCSAGAPGGRGPRADRRGRDCPAEYVWRQGAGSRACFARQGHAARSACYLGRVNLP